MIHCGRLNSVYSFMTFLLCATILEFPESAMIMLLFSIDKHLGFNKLILDNTLSNMYLFSVFL